MKKTYLIFLLLIVASTLFGQGNSGLGFNYQAVVRGIDGFVLQRQPVELRFSFMPGQQATQASWIETHNTETDDFGYVGIIAGEGIKTGGEAATFADVNFAAVHYWMKVEIKEGSNYRELSYSALPSVPYARAAANAEIMPAGTIVPYGGNVIPAGWILCDGREVNRSEYANLYAAIGTIWGHGNNSTTFNLPDMRGVFLRGVSGNSGKDVDAATRIPLKEGGNSGNNVGSYQKDAIRNISGQMVSAASYLSGAFYSTSAPINGIGHGGNFVGGWGTGIFDASRVVPTGSDNRPQNVYINYIIKY
jgi:microcystin-dependent protein